MNLSSRIVVLAISGVCITSCVPPTDSEPFATLRVSVEPGTHHSFVSKIRECAKADGFMFFSNSEVGEDVFHAIRYDQQIMGRNPFSQEEFSVWFYRARYVNQPTDYPGRDIVPTITSCLDEAEFVLAIEREGSIAAPST